MLALRKLVVQNFKSLRQVEVSLGPLNVLVGPNSAGKTNLLSVIRFLGTSARVDLAEAVNQFGGFSRLCFRGPTGSKAAHIRIAVSAQVTTHSSAKATDEYVMAFNVIGRGGSGRTLLRRHEEFTFKRRSGRGRRISVRGSKLEISAEGTKRLNLEEGALALSTLPKLARNDGGEQVEQMADLFKTFRVFEVDVDAARRPSDARDSKVLRPDASNLAAFVDYLSAEHEDEFERLQADAIEMIPGLQELVLQEVGGPTRSNVLMLREKGLRDLTPLADASFSTVRLLALLALLHDPSPPKLTCVEEIDHGLHPHLFDRLVERLREASQRTQILVATHSPALVNRLNANELIVCERDLETGASRIPAIGSTLVSEKEKVSGLGLGELWFSGSLGGTP